MDVVVDSVTVGVVGIMIDEPAASAPWVLGLSRATIISGAWHGVQMCNAGAFVGTLGLHMCHAMARRGASSCPSLPARSLRCVQELH